MGFFGPSIESNDYYLDIQDFILEKCNLTYEEYLDKNRLLTRGMFEKVFNEITEMAVERDPIIGYHTLGAFILKTGAKLPIDLKNKIIEAIDYEITNMSMPQVDVYRKFHLVDLKEKISKHKPGQITHLACLMFNIDNDDPKTASVGLNQFLELVQSGDLKYVKHINLDGWHLKSFPEPMLELKSLKTLSLSHNLLKTLPESIGDLNTLEKLYLNGNQLNFLPESIGNLKSLQILNLMSNNLSSLSDSIGNLISLKELNLHYNRLRALPESIGNLNSLKKLCLFNNNLTTLPESISRLKELLYIYIGKKSSIKTPYPIYPHLEWNSKEGLYQFKGK